jgi:hypothetical protein
MTARRLVVFWGWGMIRVFAGACLALIFIAPSMATAKTPPRGTAKPAPFCKTLKGEWVGFGEDDTRKEAEARLDKEIAAWAEHSSLAAVKPKDRKTDCNIYIEFLGEYRCKAEAAVCR